MANQSFVNDFTDYTRDDIVEAYQSLATRHVALKKSEEKSRQREYECSRKLELALVREEHLNNELESASEAGGNAMQVTIAKLHAELEDVRQRMDEFRERAHNAEAEADELRQKVDELEDQTAVASVSLPHESILSDNQRDYMEKLETLNADIMKEQIALRDEITALEQKLAEAKRDEDAWKDRCMCAEENLEAKRSELEESLAAKDSLEEKVALLSAELAAFQSQASDPNKKGNSLFGELDDQRQYMRNLLKKQKVLYDKMKHEHQCSERQIRMLKKENAAMRDEVDICTRMFRDAQHWDKRNLIDRITCLKRETDRLIEDKKFLEKSLRDFAKNQDLNWVGPTLDQAQMHTDKLREELRAEGVIRYQADEGLCKALESEAKWRFEALKSRCIIIQREALLEEHNIPFEPIDRFEANELATNRYKNPSAEKSEIDYAVVVKTTAEIATNSAPEPIFAVPKVPVKGVPFKSIPGFADLSVLTPTDMLLGSLPDSNISIELMPDENELFPEPIEPEESADVDGTKNNEASIVTIDLMSSLTGVSTNVEEKTPTTPDNVALHNSTNVQREKSPATPVVDATLESPPPTTEHYPTPPGIVHEAQEVMRLDMNAGIVSLTKNSAVPQYRPIKMKLDQLDLGNNENRPPNDSSGSAPSSTKQSSAAGLSAAPLFDSVSKGAAQIPSTQAHGQTSPSSQKRARRRRPNIKMTIIE